MVDTLVHLGLHLLGFGINGIYLTRVKCEKPFRRVTVGINSNEGLYV